MSLGLIHTWLWIPSMCCL